VADSGDTLENSERKLEKITFKYGLKITKSEKERVAKITLKVQTTFAFQTGALTMGGTSTNQLPFIGADYNIRSK
jgi:hypothetical protein